MKRLSAPQAPRRSGASPALRRSGASPALRRSGAVAAATLGLSLVLVAVGCGSSGPAKPSDPVLAQGQSVYIKDCASCHGNSGNGGAGPKLKGVVAQRYSLEQHKAIIADGRSGGMPGWKDRLSADDIEAVARYEREGL